jgi:hypothetical protein
VIVAMILAMQGYGVSLPRQSAALVTLLRYLLAIFSVWALLCQPIALAVGHVEEGGLGTCSQPARQGLPVVAAMLTDLPLNSFF